MHLNDGSDGSLEWVKSQGIKYTQSAKNVGVCLSVNHLVAQARHDWVLFMNDDMVAAPGWDTAFIAAIQSVDTDLALFFGTQIMRENGGNDIIIKQNFGESPATFDEAKFLQHYLADGRRRYGRRGIAAHPGEQEMVEHGRRIQSWSFRLA